MKGGTHSKKHCQEECNLVTRVINKAELGPINKSEDCMMNVSTVNECTNIQDRYFDDALYG